ncbi:MAG: LysE family transporter [Paludibacter sp.]|nr:LysE family transporter [Paludibacter sp.]
MIEIIIKGIIIGLFVSVPLGPIGMLCVQRTLNRGRRYGIATGLGATTSDLIYTIVALFFIGFVVDFLEDKKLIIQITGSIIVIIFGVFINRSNPSRQPMPDQRKHETLMNDFFSSFILTLSNPLILFVLIALFARFEFLDNNTTFFLNVIGLLSILGGAFLWWSVLTFLVSKFRNKLSYRGLKMMNRIIGIIIIVIGSFGILYNVINILSTK